MPDRAPIAVLLSIFVGAHLCAAEPTIGTGYRYDGTGVYPDTNPPLQWHNGWKIEGHGKKARWVPGGSTTGMKWRAPLPNWGSGGPIVVAGKVIVLSEPTDYAPIVQCYDAGSGKLLWQDTLDPCDAIPGAAGLKQEWSGLFARARGLLRLRAEQKAIRKLTGEAKDSAQAAWQAKAAKLGVEDMGFKKYSTVTIGKAYDAATKKRVDALRKKGLYFMVHHVGFHRNGIDRGTWSGYTYATPVTDGRHVYISTGYNTTACYDLEGEQLWHRWLGAPLDRKKMNKAKGWNDASFYPSPCLVGGTLVVSNPGYLVGLDPATGKEKWKAFAPRDRSRGVHYTTWSPLPLVLDGTACVFHYDGILYRASDGKALSESHGIMHWNHSPAVRDGTVAYIRNDGLTRGPKPLAEAVDLTPLLAAGSTATKGTILWTTPFNVETYIDHIWHGDRLFVATRRFDRQSGQRGDEAMKRVRYSGIGWVSAGGYFFAGSGMDKIGPDNWPSLRLYVHDKNGKKLPEIRLPLEPPSEERKELIRGEIGADRWGMFGNATPFFVGKRVYVRSFDHLYCFEK